MGFLNVIREIIATPALLVGLATLIGLLLQKKPLEHVIKGTATAVIGFVLLAAGSEFLQKGALSDFGVLFNYNFHIQGVIPNMEAVTSLGIAQYAAEVSEVMFFGMIANLVIARYSSLKYIFLTGHHTLYMACLLIVVLHGSKMTNLEILVSGTLILGLCMSVFPALAQKEMEKVTGNKKIALGHFSVIGCMVAARTAAFVASRWGSTDGRNSETEKLGESDQIVETRKKIKSTEDIHFSKKLAFMRDSTVSIFLIMTLIFLFLSGIAASKTDLSQLDISYQYGGYKSWIIYSVLQGAQFSAAIYVILAGVRLIIAEIIPAFKGIAKKVVPHAKPAVDCPVLFSYAPNAVMIGFLSSFAGGIAAMLFMIAINAWSGKVLVPVIVPGVVAHFFCGGTAGVFANKEGGMKGCLAGTFVHGVLISALAMIVMPLLGNLNLSGTTFSDSDFCATGILIGNLIRAFPENGILSLSVICFLIPIVREQFRKRKKKV